MFTIKTYTLCKMYIQSSVSLMKYSFSLCVCWTFQSTEPGGHFICTVYLEEKKETAEQHVKVTWTKWHNIIWHLTFLAHSSSLGWCTMSAIYKTTYSKLVCCQAENCVLCPQIPGSMTAAELTCEVLDRRNIPVKAKEYWSCWEVTDKEEMGETDGN